MKKLLSMIVLVIIAVALTGCDGKTCGSCCGEDGSCCKTSCANGCGCPAE